MRSSKSISDDRIGRASDQLTGESGFPFRADTPAEIREAWMVFDYFRERFSGFDRPSVKRISTCFLLLSFPLPGYAPWSVYSRRVRPNERQGSWRVADYGELSLFRSAWFDDGRNRRKGRVSVSVRMPLAARCSGSSRALRWKLGLGFNAHGRRANSSIRQDNLLTAKKRRLNIFLQYPSSRCDATLFKKVIHKATRRGQYPDSLLLWNIAPSTGRPIGAKTNSNLVKRWSNKQQRVAKSAH